MATKKKSSSRSRGGGYRYRRVSESGDKVYFFGGGSPAPSERSERIVERDISSAPMRDSGYGPSRRSNAGGMIIGLALLGGAAAAVYYYYTISKCSTKGATKCENGSEYTCKPFPMEELRLWDAWQKTGTCDGGGGGGGGGACQSGVDQPKCIGNNSYQCLNNEWVAGGGLNCGGGGGSCLTVDEACIEGAVQCNANGLQLYCEGGCWKSAGVNCPTEACVGVQCISTEYVCDDQDTLFFYPKCNPIMGECDWMRSTPNAQLCLYPEPGELSVLVNGVDPVVNGVSVPVDVSGTGHCYTDNFPLNDLRAKFPPIPVDIVALDKSKRPLRNASVKISPRSNPCPIFFAQPGFENTGLDNMQVFPCATYENETDSNGRCIAVGRLSWDYGFGTTRTYVFRVAVTANGKTVSQDISIRVTGYGKTTLGSPISTSTCEYMGLDGDQREDVAKCQH